MDVKPLSPIQETAAAASAPAEALALFSLGCHSTLTAPSTPGSLGFPSLTKSNVVPRSALRT